MNSFFTAFSIVTFSIVGVWLIGHQMQKAQAQEDQCTLAFTIPGPDKVDVYRCMTNGQVCYASATGQMWCGK